jgi:hypothetical protein
VTAEEYAAAQAALAAQIASYTVSVGSLVITTGFTVQQWVQLLQVLFPEVSRMREQSATLARDYYDQQRQFHVPQLERHDRYLEGTDFRQFVKDMEPARKKVMEVTRVVPSGPAESGLVNTPDLAQLLDGSRLQKTQKQKAIVHLTLQTVREVENAGRRQIIHAVQEDMALDAYAKDSRKGQFGGQVVRGWARVATGKETCAWCLMLISRGPVYLEANTAGLDMETEQAIQAVADGKDVTDFMEQWHAGCDCKVVPVFKISEWPGRDAWKNAEALWVEAGKEAAELRQNSPGRVHTTGKNKGERITLSEDTVNAIRRRISRGEVNMAEFAGLAA